jgi:hypothetical protein
MSSSKECPVYLKEREIQKIKIEKNIGYEEVFVGVFEDVLGCDEHAWLENV